MLTFLYCLDENYNTQSIVSLSSLLNNVSKKINVIFLHKNPETLKTMEIFDNVFSHERLNNVDFIKFNKDNIDFPNLENVHVSEATYYRLYITNHIDIEGSLIYIDPDVICLNDPIKELEDLLVKLENSQFVVSAHTETLKSKKNIEEFQRLLMNGDKLFNAGVMLIDFKKWKNLNLTPKLTERLRDIYDDIVFWDQDVLNSFFDSNFLNLDKKFNYKINDFNNVETNSLQTILEIKKDIIFAHYSGKFKPWTVRGTFHPSSRFYQNEYAGLSKNHYHIENNWKGQAFKDLIKYILNREILKLEKPVRFFTSVLNYLFRFK